MACESVDVSLVDNPIRPVPENVVLSPGFLINGNHVHVCIYNLTDNNIDFSLII